MQIEMKRLLALGLLVVITTSIAVSYSVNLLAFISPTEEVSMKVRWVKSLDLYGYERESFSAGDAVTLLAKIEMGTHYRINNYGGYGYYGNTQPYTEDANYVLIYTILDENNNPVFFGSVAGTISPGQVQYKDIDFNIPSDMSDGTYNIQTYLWSDWLPSGEYLSSDIGASSFVIGGVV